MEDSITVLLIEDNDADARFVEKMLASSKTGPFSIERTARLSEGLLRLSTGGIDIIVLDLSLPDAHGLDTFTTVHTKFPEIPIVVLSGLSDENLASQAVNGGAQDYILKDDVDTWLGRSIRYAITRGLSEKRIKQINDELSRQTRDLTEANRKLNELTAALEVTRDRALQASQVKSAFVANMSHELRTPLSGIISAAELLSSLNLGSDETALVDLLLNSATGLLSILNDILDLAKIETGRLVLEEIVINVLFVIQDAARCMSVSAAAKGLAFHCNLDYRLPELVTGDPVRLRQILLNLIGNAIKFTDKGNVLVAADVHSLEADRVVIKFTVSDTGIGIEEDQQQQVFSPFVQADKSITRCYGGTGLGLSISKELVEMMGGELKFTSKPDVGSTFWFTVPFGLPVSGEPHLQRTGSATARMLKFTGIILIAEDNKMASELLLRQLSSMGLQGFIVDTGQAALQAVRDNHFDLLLMDCHMPTMDGLEATAHIRQLEKATGAHTPIIAMTAGAIPEQKLKCLSGGMDDYLAKPITVLQLQEIFQKWLPADATKEQSPINDPDC